MSIHPGLISGSLNFFRKAYNLVDAILTGFWLGVMGEKSIERYNDVHYDRSTTYMNDIYNLSGLQQWEYDILKKYFPKARTFLIIGAGGGRETAALRKWNREVDSYECSEQLIEYANDFLQRNKIDAKISFLPKNSVPVTLKQYEGIILGWGAYSHIPGRNLRISFLESLKPFCTDGTSVMVSFLTRDQNSRKDMITKKVSDLFRFLSGRKKIEYGDRLLDYYAHFFTRNEIESELNESGFSMIGYSDKDYGCIVAQKY